MIFNPIGFLLLMSAVAASGEEGASPAKAAVVRDFDSPAFENARDAFLDPKAGADVRIRTMHDLVRRNSGEASDLLAGALEDKNLEIARRAAEWLAVLGDRRGLDVQGRCIETMKCRFPFDAARFVGIWRDIRYAPALSKRVEALLEKHLRPDGKWWGSAEEEAFLRYGSIALARMGRLEDRDLVIRTVKANPLTIGVEALGYVDDPRSREMLWSAYNEWTRLSGPPSCESGSLTFPALLALSRLGEPLAIDRMKNILRGVGTPPDHTPEGKLPALCVDREAAFRLRRRDAVNFAEVVFEVASQKPEGAGTMEAWEALGVMRPRGFGERMLKLATSKPQWRFVDRQTLFQAVIAVDPSLAERFWGAFNLKVVPAERGLKSFVENGVGYLMFRRALTGRAIEPNP